MQCLYLIPCSPSSHSAGEIEDEGLRFHNYFRSVHNARPLQLSPSLNAGALQIAKRILAQKNLQGSDMTPGESVDLKCSEELTASEAIKSWYLFNCSLL